MLNILSTRLSSRLNVAGGLGRGGFASEAQLGGFRAAPLGGAGLGAWMRLARAAFWLYKKYYVLVVNIFNRLWVMFSLCTQC